MKIPHGIGGLRPDTINEPAVAVKNLGPKGSAAAKSGPLAPLIGKMKGASEELKRAAKRKKARS